MFTKNCQICNCIQEYSSKESLANAIRLKSKCKKCHFLEKTNNDKNYRFCPICNTKINYNTKYSAKNSEKNKAKCKKCSIVYANRDVYRTDSYKQKMSKITSGKNNPMYGRNFYDVWLVKYGKEKADLKLKEKGKKQSKLVSGSNNPMYGKPSPSGSGNGWKGWYKDVFFRSLRELCFMIECDNRGLFYTNGEKIRIPYIDFKGNNRTYAPDFLIDNKLIEIKPIRLQDSPNNLLKFQAAKEYCKNNNLDFWVIDIVLDSILINSNMANIRFQDKYLTKYKKYETEKS